MNLFDNTKVAFSLKSDSQLERAYFLFKMIQNQPMVRIGSAVTNFALKANLPIEGLIRSTVFDHFCGGVTEDDCIPVIDHMYEKGNVHSVLDYSVEGKDEEISFDEALKKIETRTIDSMNKLSKKFDNLIHASVTSVCFHDWSMKFEKEFNELMMHD